MTRADARVAELAVSQLGLLSRSQAFRLGVSDRQIASRLRDGTWQRAAPGVYQALPFPPSHRRSLWRAYLAAQAPAHVSHEAAAEVNAIPGFRRGIVSLLVPNGDHHRISGVVVHQTRDLWLPEWTVVHDGLPVTSPARTIVDMSATSSKARLGHALDEAVAARILRLDEVSACLVAVARRGKRGLTTLGDVLDDRGPGWVPAQSTLERRLFELLRRAGEPAPKRQFPLPGRQLGRGLVDAAYIEAKLILEVDGRRWHTRIADLRRDHDRDAEAGRVGWHTLRILYEHLRGDPHGTVARIRETRLIRISAAA